MQRRYLNGIGSAKNSGLGRMFDEYATEYDASQERYYEPETGLMPNRDYVDNGNSEAMMYSVGNSVQTVHELPYIPPAPVPSPVVSYTPINIPVVPESIISPAVPTVYEPLETLSQPLTTSAIPVETVVNPADYMLTNNGEIAVRRLDDAVVTPQKSNKAIWIGLGVALAAFIGLEATGTTNITGLKTAKNGLNGTKNGQKNGTSKRKTAPKTAKKRPSSRVTQVTL
ncbi:hypothetical protein [Roseivirga seohaensis]|uniref:hypothetical protein n=1 Tax=Roseivirga seohaensis TaxID=1914963 RepID=UPI003BA8EE4F